MNIDRMRWPARSTSAAPLPVGGFLLAATLTALLTVAAGCESPSQQSAWEKAGATTSEAVEDAKKAAAESAEDGWQAIKDGSEKVWDSTKRTSVAVLEKAKEATGVVSEE